MTTPPGVPPGVPPADAEGQAELADMRRQIAALEQQIAALQSENAHLHMVADFTYDWEYWIDPAGTLRYVSPACERITGYRPAEFQADAGLLERCIHPDDRERVVRHPDDEQQQPQTCELQFRIIRRDGEQRWIGHACQPVYSAAGEWLGRRVSNRDITAWVQAEEAYHTLVENSLQGLVIFQEGRFVFANPAMVDIVGYSREELLAFTPDTIHQLLHPDDYERVMGYTRARQMGQAVPSGYEIRLIRKDGAIRRVEVAVSLTNYRGRAATQVAYIDITERKQAEEALRASEQQIRRIGDNLPNGIIYQLRQATDGTCTFTYMSDAVKRLTGYTAEEIIAQPPLVLNSHHEEDQPGYIAAMEAAARTLQSMDYELRQYVADGTLRWRQFYSTPRREPDGTIIWDGICIDITERKQAEEALRTSERFVQQIATTMPDILYIFDLALQRNIYSNRQIAESLGYTPEEVQAMGDAVLPTLLHPDDLPCVLQHQTMQADAPDGIILPLEYRMRHREGSWRWLLSREVVFSRTDAGNPCQILGVAQDITERKLAEEAYRTLVDNSLQGLTIHQQGRSVFANAAAAQITGYTVDELLALSPAEAAATIHPDDRDMVMQRARERQAGTTVPQHYTFRILHKDGSVRWLEAFAIRVIYQGQPAAQMAYIDITERKQAEDALRASEARLKAIFDNAAIGIGLTDTSGKLVALNAHGARQLGYTPEELAHTSNLQLTHPDDQATTREHIRRLLRGEIDGYRIEKRFLPKDGRLFWADLSVTPVRNPAGQIEYLLGIVVDITERKQAEEALRQYRHIVSASLDSLSLVDRQYSYRVVNNAYLRRTTRSYRDIVGHSVAEVMGADTFAHLLKAKLDRCLDGETVHYCAWFDYVDEGRKFMDVTYTPYRDDQDRIQGVVVSARDITHLKQAEEALRASEARYRTLVEHFPDGVVFLFDHDLRYLVAGGQQLASVGMHPEMLEGKTLWEATPPDIAAIGEPLYRATLAGTAPKEVEQHYGDQIYRTQPVSLRNEQGEIVAGMIISQNITERKQSELQLQHANEQLHQANVWLRERNHEVLLLNQMGDLLQGCTGVAEAYEVIAASAEKLFPEQAGALYLRRAGSNQFDVVAAWGTSAPAAATLDQPDCQALQQQQVCRCTTSDSGMCRNLQDGDGAMVLCVPLLVRGETLGILQLRYATPPDTEACRRRQQLADIVAHQISLALTNLTLREQLQQQAIRDPLTGLYNRRYLDATLPHELQRGDRYAHPVAVVMLDIDHFKRFNDTYGHDAGDTLLREVGSFLQAHTGRGYRLPLRRGGVYAGVAGRIAGSYPATRRDDPCGDPDAGRGAPGATTRPRNRVARCGRFPRPRHQRRYAYPDG